MSEALGIIPARWGSTRLPGKPLADIGGRSLVRRVWERASAALDRVVVATDDERIAGHVAGFGGKALMTSPGHRTGTERCGEASRLMGAVADTVVVNVQGDEPFLDPGQLRLVVSAFDEPAVRIATLAVPIRDAGELVSPHVPKVVLSRAGTALYFSRQPIPHLRDADRADRPARPGFLKHIGVYAYRAATLAELVRLDPTPLEEAESLEQLRWLEHGYAIAVRITDTDTVTVDTPEDLEKARHRAGRETA